MGFSVWKCGLAISWRLSLLAVILLISIPTSDCNEFIGNSNAFDKPFFTKEPEDYYYIVKNKPITVTCEAVRADEILIKCSDVYVTDITRTEVHVDRLTKVKTITASVDVTKDDLEEYFGSDTYWCECDAIANVHGSKSQLRTVSKRGLVQAAYLRRRFEREPISIRVAIDTSAVLPCLPPVGKPRPEVFWLKDGDEIDVRRNNYIVASEGDLMIGQVKLADMGNYTCGARNILTKRLSDFATLTVFVNGGWSTWSPWTECSTKCGKGTQRRSRTCSNPTPLNGGTVCNGEPVQKLSCNSICPVKGQWSPWSSWSTCNPDCIYHRRRSCDNPRPANGGGFCNGNDLDSSNCTGGMCRGSKRKTGSGNNKTPVPPTQSNFGSNSDTVSDFGKDRNHGFFPVNGPEKEATATAESGDENIAMYIGLCVAVVVFAMLIVVIVVVIRRWKKHQLLDANHAGLSDDEKKVNKNGTDMMSVQPDLTQTVVTVAHHSNSPSPTIDPPSAQQQSCQFHRKYL
ncbi:hypothetical protein KUTeg_003964 [Tegillarca granosa]|uniref:Ig-like domain-containing protein n=1 Tax=Tegillarca granosa TaxID=220873 RepID=A0ABQ9FNL6_TEGGR|nr:hypothetical protein KUTeg_003964 [Tegillarca granosa]